MTTAMFRRLSKSGVLVQWSLLLLIGVVLWLPAFSHTLAIRHFRHAGPLFEASASVLRLCGGAGTYIVFALVYGISLFTAQVLSAGGMIHRENFLPAFPVMISFSWHPALTVYHPFIPASIALLFGLYFFLRSYNSPLINRLIFSAAFSFGLAFLVYYPLWVLLLLMWSGFYAMRTNNWRAWAISAIGFLIPVLYAFSWFYLQGSLAVFWDQLQKNTFSLPHSWAMAWPYAVWMALCSVLMLLFTLITFANISDKLLYIRRKTWVFLNWAIVGLFLFVSSGSPLMEVQYFLAVPFAFFATASLHYPKKATWGEVWFWSGVAGLVTIRFFMFMGV